MINIPQQTPEQLNEAATYLRDRGYSIQLRDDSLWLISPDGSYQAIDTPSRRVNIDKAITACREWVGGE